MLNCNLIKNQIISVKPLIGTTDPQKPDAYIEAKVRNVLYNSFTIEISSEYSYMKKGTLISLLFNCNGRFLAGQSRILEVDIKDCLCLRLSGPHKLQRIEMRKWFRVPVDLNMRYRLAGYPFDYFATNTLNISGGGLMFLASHVVDKDLELEIEIELPDQNPDQNILKGTAKVRRCEELRTPLGVFYGIGCSLEAIDEYEREKLIKFLFEQQRVLIQKRALYQK
ncbi:MAG: PilZ domain-containing protein [Syntrophomonas sp.]